MVRRRRKPVDKWESVDWVMVIATSGFFLVLMALALTGVVKAVYGPKDTIECGYARDSKNAYRWVESCSGTGCDHPEICK